MQHRSPSLRNSTSRTRNRILSFVAALLLVSLTSAAWAAPMRILTDSDKGAKVVIHDGDQIELRLASNPSTGYKWYVHADSTPLMNLISQSDEPSKSPGMGTPGVGRPIVQIFRFEAVKMGDGVLLLRYARSWEKPEPDEQQFDLHVSIR